MPTDDLPMPTPIIKRLHCSRRLQSNARGGPYTIRLHAIFHKHSADTLEPSSIVHCVQKKTLTLVLLYISVENVQTFTKFLGSVWEETRTPLVKKVRYSFLLVTLC